MNIPKEKYEIVIVGAGPAGMAAAFELCKAKREFIVIEKSHAVGGLAKTHIIREGDLEFRTDIGPHRFYSKKEFLIKFVDEILEQKFNIVKRQTRQYIDGKFYDYPINAGQAFKNLGYMEVARILADYLIAIVTYRVFKKKITNFYDYAVANFGKRLAMFNIINYTEKTWGISANQLNANWGSKRIGGLTMSAVIKNILKIGEQPKWYKNVS